MLPVKTLLILGAGASEPYGFPDRPGFSKVRSNSATFSVVSVGAYSMAYLLAVGARLNPQIERNGREDRQRYYDQDFG
jgi:hypothetical protein